jgi:hypothetical protein
VNIFTFDPVLGPTSYLYHSLKLDINVRLYRSIIQLDENYWMFPRKPVHKENNNNLTLVDLIPLPGMHSTAVYLQSDVGTIAASLLGEFLVETGTVLDQYIENDLRDNSRLANLYARVFIERNRYKKIKKGMSVKDRSEGVEAMGLEGLPDRVSHFYFINSHHQRVFRDAYPLAYRDLFVNGGNQTNVELLTPLLTESLVRAQVLPYNGAPFFFAP